jgi:hypothetical protein
MTHIPREHRMVGKAVKTYSGIAGKIVDIKTHFTDAEFYVVCDFPGAQGITFLGNGRFYRTDPSPWDLVWVDMPGNGPTLSEPKDSLEYFRSRMGWC